MQKTVVREDSIARVVLDAAMDIHRSLGPGLLESVYEAILARELTRRGLKVERQKPISIVYNDLHFEEGFRADLIVDECVIVEVKSVEAISRAHRKQLLTYLRLMDKRLGLLINFGAALLKDGFARIVNGLPDASSAPTGNASDQRHQ